MSELDFMSVLHKSTQRDYLARVNDPEYQKRGHELAKKFGYEYWDEIGVYVMEAIGTEGRWEKSLFQSPNNTNFLSDLNP